MTARPRPRATAAPRPAPRRRPEARPAPRSRRRPALRLRARVLWLPVITLLLGGIVWVNVAKLQLTRQTSAVVERQNVVQSENIRLNARLQQQSGAVQQLAQDRLGMESPASAQTQFLRVPAITPR